MFFKINSHLIVVKVYYNNETTSSKVLNSLYMQASTLNSTNRNSLLMVELPLQFRSSLYDACKDEQMSSR